MKKNICTPEETKQLKELCRGGRLYEVEAWIRQGKPVNAPATERKSPLLIAVQKGFYSLVELLLRSGADPNANGKVLEAAVMRGDIDITRLLLDNGIDPYSVYAPLVCMCGNLDLVRLFLDRGIDLTEGNGFAEGLIETKKALRGIFRSYRDKIPALQQQADFALYECCKNGFFGAFYRLLWAGANPRAKVPGIRYFKDRPEMYVTTLELIVSLGHFELLKHIGVDPARDDLNHLLREATLAAKPKIIRYLVEHGADINSRDSLGQNCLMLLFRNLDRCKEMPTTPRSLCVTGGVLEGIKTAVELGARFGPINAATTHLIRLGFYATGDYELRCMLKVFRKHRVLPDAELIRLLDTPRMIEHVKADLTEFLKMFPNWSNARKYRTEIEEKRRRWR